MNRLRKGRCPKMNQKQFVLTLSVAVISGFLGGALSVWFLMPPSVLAQDEPQKVIEAQIFHVVDENGRVTATLGTKDEVTGLSFFDRDVTKTLITLGVAKDKTSLSFTDKRGTTRLALSGEEGRSIELYDEEGNRRMIFGSSAILFVNEEGKLEDIVPPPEVP